MFNHARFNGIGKGETTIMISGAAVFTHAQEMQNALGDALDACDHLTIDVGRVEAMDLTFRALLCSLHRRSELVNKKISMQGALPRREGYPVRHRVKGCLFKATGECCQLWESIAKDGGDAAGRRTS
jgi:ABC-type transporter Mla MlaB component